MKLQGKLYRQAGDFRIEVTSGIDWFELHGGVTFGGQEVPLPTLLAALRHSEDLVPLGDGSFGLLPLVLRGGCAFSLAVGAILREFTSALEANRT